MNNHIIDSTNCEIPESCVGVRLYSCADFTVPENTHGAAYWRNTPADPSVALSKQVERAIYEGNRALLGGLLRAENNAPAVNRPLAQSLLLALIDLRHLPELDEPYRALATAVDMTLYHTDDPGLNAYDVAHSEAEWHVLRQDWAGLRTLLAAQLGPEGNSGIALTLLIATKHLRDHPEIKETYKSLADARKAWLNARPV